MELIEALRQPRCYPHPVGPIRVIETHISWIVLTGDFAYKVKKPVNLGFLDFTELERRHFFCQEELRLNRRLAPEYYLNVVTITGSADQPKIGGSGPIVDYALKMKQFPAGALLSEIYAQRAPVDAEVQRLAEDIAAFHRAIGSHPPPQDFGAAEITLHRCEENFEAPLRTVADDTAAFLLRDLQAWSERQGQRLRPAIERRRAEGFVREGHGDLHLGNIFLRDATPIIFDCIEFAPDLRWIDVINDLAFLTMDLRRAGHADAAYDLLNRYLHVTGDYSGVALWRYYEIYRAMVRAKIAALRLEQTADQASEHARFEMLGYIRLASALRHPSLPRLILTHGFSGSGKSTVCRAIAPGLRAIWVRSDVERKRLHGLRAEQRSQSDLNAGIYQASATEATYAKLQSLAQDLLRDGYSVIVDATFLRHWQRQLFFQIAAVYSVPLIILHCRAPETTVRGWLRRRTAAGADPSEADEHVFEGQLEHHDPLTTEEKHHTLAIDTSRTLDPGLIREAIAVRAARDTKAHQNNLLNKTGD